MIPFPNKKYQIICADPPWELTRAGGWHTTKNHIGLAYPVMSVDDIKMLPVKSITCSTSFLFLWVVNAFVEYAYDVSRSWGFRPVSLLTWCKKPIGIGPGGFFASTTEFILYARKGSCPDGRRKEINTSWWNWDRGKRHSEKPNAFFKLIEDHFNGPRIELFARKEREGWDVWGDEIKNLNSPEAVSNCFNIKWRSTKKE